MSEENLALVQQAVEAFNRHDATGFGALLTPDAEVVPLRAAVEDVSYSGPDAAEDFFSDVDQTWSNVAIEPTGLRDAGEAVLAFGRLRARGRNSGVEVEMSLAWVLRFSGGHISKLEVFTDPDDALGAAGLSE